MRQASMAALAGALLLVSCSDGDAEPGTIPVPPSDAATTGAPVDTTTPSTGPPASTAVVEPTEPTVTPTDASAASTSTTTTEVRTTTTVSERALKAKIAADYERSAELLNELASNPTLENLDARLAEIAVSWSANTGESGDLGSISTTSATRWLAVAEIQAVITDTQSG